MRRLLRPRVVLPAVVVLAAAGWAIAATRGLERGAVYYYTPSELSARVPSEDVIRVGGTVVRGSLRWDSNAGVLRFMLSDGSAAIPRREPGRAARPLPRGCRRARRGPAGRRRPPLVGRDRQARRELPCAEGRP